MKKKLFFSFCIFTYIYHYTRSFTHAHTHTHSCTCAHVNSPYIITIDYFALTNVSFAQVFMLKVILAFRVVLPRCHAKACDTLARKSLSPGSHGGSRRGSRTSSGNASAVSIKSNKSPNHTNNITDPVLENVTVEILDVKHK